MYIHYVTSYRDNARDLSTIQGLREAGVHVTETELTDTGWKKYQQLSRALRYDTHNPAWIIVGYTGVLFVPFVRLISRTPIVYNALASFYEGMIISRQHGQWFSLSSLRYWITDTVAFHAATYILVESEAQRAFIHRVFFVPLRKLIVHYTSLDERSFFPDPAVVKHSQFAVVFRGKFLPEAGVETLIAAAPALARADIRIEIYGHGMLEKKVRELVAASPAKNILLVTDFLPIDHLRNAMLKCHLSIGQLAQHPRLTRTIPHKAFESAVLKLPYLTGRNGAVLELFTEDVTCLCCIPGDPHDLAEKIIAAKNNPEHLAAISESAYTLYTNTFSAKVLGKKLLIQLTFA
mgnify:CR=1 FL=1